MLIKNCRVVNSREIISVDILIHEGKIVKIGKDLKEGDIVNAGNRLVIPGLVDVHVHMRDFEQSRKEDFLSGSRAAIAGGVTTFVDMPNSKPPVVDGRTFRKRAAVAAADSLADFGINFGITSENLGEAEKASPVAFKVYMDGTLGEITSDTLRGAVGKCKKVAVHAEHVKGGKRDEEGAVEVVAGIAKETQKSVHICHISSANSIPHLNEYTTCEVTPHHLLLTGSAVEKFGGIAKTNPPLKSARDVNALWAALRTGKIDIIASDHAPHTSSEKEMDFPDAPPGVPNLDVMLKLLLTLVNDKKLSICDLVRMTCENPAKIFNIKDKGAIVPGNDADIVILNMDERGKIDVDSFYSKARYSPFEGWKTRGDVDKVFLRGMLAFDDGIALKKGYGRMISTD